MASVPPQSLDRLDESILTLLRERGPLTQTQVAVALGADTFGVNEVLERLGRRGRALRAGRTRQHGRTGWNGWGVTRWATVWAAAPEPR